MYCRYVVNKINDQTNCYQGVLVTLGNKMLKNKLSDQELPAVKSVFDNLEKILPTPSGFDSGLDNVVMKKSVSWLKKDSACFNDCLVELDNAKKILQKMGYEVLLLEANSLNGILYEDSLQVLTESNQNEFRIIFL